jgi:hypothetical protein
VNKIKKVLERCLHDPTTAEGRIINGLLSFLILFSIAVIPLHLFAKIPDYQWIETNLFLFEKITVSLFTIEYILRIWTSKRSQTFIFSWEGIVDFIAIAPFYLEKLGIGGGYFELFLLLRILRILKFSVMYGKEAEALQRCQQKRHGELYMLPTEKVEQIVQKHPIVFMVALIIPLIFITAGLFIIIFSHGLAYENTLFAFAFLCFIFAAIFFYKAWLDYQYDVIYITNYRVILQNHELFGSETNGLTYDSITNVVPNNRGFIRWALGLGHIEIETANRDATIIFEDVPHPHKVVSRISENRIKHEERTSKSNSNNLIDL